MKNNASLALYIKLSVQLLINNPKISALKIIWSQYKVWKKYNQPEADSITEKLPWITFAAIVFIKKNTFPDSIVFEFGSGGSTLFFSQNASMVISVEHDENWYKRVQTEIEKLNIQNIKQLLIKPEKNGEGIKGNIENPSDYLSNDPQFAGMNFRKYASEIEKYPNKFDIVLVDGRARPSCIKHALDKVKKGGYLIIDNTDRQYYLNWFTFDAKTWERNDFYGPVPFAKAFSQTTLLKRLI